MMVMKVARDTGVDSLVFLLVLRIQEVAFNATSEKFIHLTVALTKRCACTVAQVDAAV